MLLGRLCQQIKLMQRRQQNRDCNVHELGDHLKCQRLRESHVEGESNERIPDILQSSYMRDIQNGSLNNKNTSCVNTHLTTISHVALVHIIYKV